MSDIEWGAPIEVNGVRPEWLDTERFGFRYLGDWWNDDGHPVGLDFIWKNVTSIRLPATHPYYFATSRGFTYWPGGENAPADWARALTRDGLEWSNDGVCRDYIGFRHFRRTEQPAPAIAPELVERMVAFIKRFDDGPFAGIAAERKAILAELEPADPEMDLAKSINGEVEAIAAAIKAAWENGR